MPSFDPIAAAFQMRLPSRADAAAILVESNEMTLPRFACQFILAQEGQSVVSMKNPVDAPLRQTTMTRA
jgi:hypothetical protein